LFRSTVKLTVFHEGIDMQITLLITAIGMGIAYAAAPGAVNTEAIRRGVAHGGRSALLVETGSLIGDSLWALLALAGITLLAQHLSIQIILGIAGGFFLLRMGWLALHEAFTRPKNVATSTTSSRGDFATGAIFGLANPVGLAFWTGLGSSIAASGVRGMQFTLFFIGFFMGAVIWCITIAAFIHWGRRWIRPIFFRWINFLCGLALGYFGLRILWTTVQELFEHLVLSSLKTTHQ
jgi:threonine/homoserine/homoserine lactone efflux protein